MGFIILEITFKRAWFHSERPNLCLCSSPRLPSLYLSVFLSHVFRKSVWSSISYLIPSLQVFLENRRSGWTGPDEWKIYPPICLTWHLSFTAVSGNSLQPLPGSVMGFLIYIPISRVNKCSTVLGTASVLAMKVLKTKEKGSLSPEQTRTLGQLISLCSNVSIYTVIRILVTSGCPHSMWTSRERAGIMSSFKI